MRFVKKNTTKTENYEGAPAYKLNSELSLYSLVVTSIFNDKYYEDSEAQLGRLKSFIKACNPEFIAKLAIYAREQMYLRTIPMVLICESLKVHKGYDFTKIITRIIQRADEIYEILGYYQLANGREGYKKLNKLSNQLKRGIAGAFNEFDEYQLAKHDKEGTGITLRDALFLSHPKAKDENQQKIFDKITNKSLSTPYTWEVELSKGNDKKETWEQLIDSKKVGYMALLRNLRNILQAEVSCEHIKKVCDYISNEKAVRNSKQLPFRFLSAYREIQDLTQFLDAGQFLCALEEAAGHTVSNISGFNNKTRTLIACDVSGSMQTSISVKKKNVVKPSKIEYYDIGLVLGMLLRAKCDRVIMGMFGDRWVPVTPPKSNILSNVNLLHGKRNIVGTSTNGWKVIQYLLDNNIEIDKVMIFTDCQLWNSGGDGLSFSTLWSAYKKRNKNAKLYLFDLSGYGNTPVSIMRKDVCFISGWSDKIFDVLTALEGGESNLSFINKITLE